MTHNPKLPAWNRDLAYLCGLITGDGSMPVSTSKRPNDKLQKRYQIYFYSESRKFLSTVYVPLFKRLFGLEPHITIQKRGLNSDFYNCRIESIVVYNFLKELGLKIGKKAKVATVPKMPAKYEPYFLAGLLDTDGGKKGSGFGLSTASPHLAEFCASSFGKFGIPYKSCPWFHNDHFYHQIYVHRKHADQLLKKIPFKNIEKIEALNSMYASVAQLVER